MSKKIFVAVAVVIILGLGLVGYFKAVPGVGNGGELLAKIEITPKSFDFGTVELGEVLNYSFKIRNLGNKSLEIKRVATSCACTTAKVSREKIEPKEEAELLVTYDTGAMGRNSHGTGEQKRIIYIKSNDPVNPQVEVTIHAYVK